jgi:hypothetical protein
MRWPFWRLAIGPSVVVFSAMMGCTPANKIPAGAPLLVKFSVIDPSGQGLELVTEAGVSTVPPLSKFYALFDRLLDATALETVEGDGGTLTPKEGVARITWSGGAIPAQTLYIPNGDPKFTQVPAIFLGIPFGNGPSLTITPLSGLPSGSMVTVGLDPMKVRSHDQTTPFMAGDGGSASLTFVTDPLAASVVVPAVEPPDGGDVDGGASDGGDAGMAPGVQPPVDTDYVVHVSFNNQTAASTAAQIHASVGGIPISAMDAMVTPDDMSQGGWTVTPPNGGWPPGAMVTITVGAGAADNFGQTLGAPVSASFTVKP